jgi:ATP synthase protein I
MHKVLVGQVVIALGVVLAYLTMSGTFAALSALFGGAITVLNSLLLAQRVRSASERAQANITRGLAVLYLGALQRFVLTLALLALGLGVLKLMPVPLIVGFALGQMGFLVNVGSSSESSRTP